MKTVIVKTDVSQDAHRGLKALAGIEGKRLKDVAKEILEREGRAVAERLAGKK